MRGTRVPAIVSSDFRLGAEVVGRPGPWCARTHTTTRRGESAPARIALGGRGGSLRMPAAAAARYRRPSARAPSPAGHHGSPSRYLCASRDDGAPRYRRVRSCRSVEATGARRQAGASGHEKMPLTYPRLRVDQRLERTSVSSNHQARANAGAELCLLQRAGGPAAPRRAPSVTSALMASRGTPNE